MREKEREYREHPNYNYSSLSALANSPGYYRHKLNYKESSQALDNGSAVDILLTNPMEFDEVFVINNTPKPGGQLGDYCDHFFRLGDEVTAYELAGFKRDKIETVKERFNKEALGYYNFLQESKSKTVLPLEEYQKIQRAVNTLKTNAYTLKFFNNEDPDISILYQVPVYFEYMGYSYKILIDIVYIDHREQSIRIYDLKTTSKGVYAFQKSFMDYKYYLQNSLYSEGLKQLQIDLDLQGYTGHKLKFIVQEIEGYNQPWIYNYNSWHDFGKEGGYYKDEYYKGFLQLSKELKWHTDNNLWEYPMDIYLNTGERVVSYEHI